MSGAPSTLEGLRRARLRAPQQPPHLPGICHAYNRAKDACISQPRSKLEKVYLAQVEGTPDPALTDALTAGVALKDGIARASWARLTDEPQLPSRNPPVTPHRAANSQWVELALTSGRNRQVRRMLAALGHPVLRLVRTRIGPLTLAGLQPGHAQEVSAEEERLIWTH